MINNSSNFYLDKTNRNLGIFTDALATVSSGTDNIAIGDSSLESLTTGSRNIGIGYSTSKIITTTNDNIMMGYEAGSGITVADNMVIGNYAGKVGSGEKNIIIGNYAYGTGTYAGTNNHSQNTVIGYAALALGGDANTAVGYMAGNSAKGYSSTFVGWQAGGIGEAVSGVTNNGNTAVGMRALATMTNGGSNTAIGQACMWESTSGTGNTCVGQGAGQQIRGDYNTCIGLGASTAVSGHSGVALGLSASCGGYKNSAAIGVNSAPTANDQVWLGDGSAITYTTNGTVTNKSSQRDTKKDIASLDEDYVDFIMSLDPVMFKYKDEIVPAIVDENGNILRAETIITHNRYHTGFIAEDVEALSSEKEIDFAFYVDPSIDDPNSAGKKTITTGELIAPLVKCVQSLQAQITDLQERINNL